MSKPFEIEIKRWSDEDLAKAMRECLPQQIPYGEMVGAEGPYGSMGPLVWQDAECYFMAEAADRLERNLPKEVNITRNKKASGWSPNRYYCPVCGKQQKMAKTGIWYCERCGQALKKTVTLEVEE